MSDNALFYFKYSNYYSFKLVIFESTIIILSNSFTIIIATLKNTTSKKMYIKNHHAYSRVRDLISYHLSLLVS